MPLEDYPASELEPRYLTKDEIANPYEVLADFFSLGHIPEIREEIWKLVKITTSGSFSKQSRRERSDMMFFFDKLTKLIEAIHLIHQNRQREIGE